MKHVITNDVRLGAQKVYEMAVRLTQRKIVDALFYHTALTELKAKKAKGR